MFFQNLISEQTSTLSWTFPQNSNSKVKPVYPAGLSWSNGATLPIKCLAFVCYMISDIQPAYPWQKEEEMRSNIYVFLFVYRNQNGSNSRSHLHKEFLKNSDKKEGEVWSNICFLKNSDRILKNWYRIIKERFPFQSEEFLCPINLIIWKFLLNYSITLPSSAPPKIPTAEVDEYIGMW